jgi:hypothetical protein
MSKHHFHTRHGSIYLVTLVTVAAIVSMIFIGLSLRTVNNSKSALIELTVESGMGVLDATEVAFEHITTDPIVRVNAQAGTIFGPLEVNKGGNILTSTVVDSATGLKPTYDTLTYRVNVNSSNDIAKANAQIDVLATPYDYLTYLGKLNLKHYWPLSEHSKPTQASDLKGSYHGKYWNPAVAGASYNEEGGPVPVFTDTKDIVTIPYGGDFKRSEGAISLWVRLTNSDRSNHAFMGTQYTLGGIPQFNMAIYKNALWVYLTENGIYDIRYALNTSNDSITVGKWHHILMSWGPAGLTIYIDGVRRARDSGNIDRLHSASRDDGGEQPWHIGGGYNMFYYPVKEDNFNGSVAHVALFDKQPIDSQVAALAAVKPDLRTYSLVADSWVRVFE